MAVLSIENYDFILAVVNMLHEARRVLFGIQNGGRGGGGLKACNIILEHTCPTY